MNETTNTVTNTSNKMSTKTLVLIGLMTAITCIIAPFVIPVPGSPVPITLGTFALYISIFVLGWKRATISCIIYLLIGLVGIPVFSGFSGGPGKLAGPTGGYLIGYLLITIVAGLLIDRFNSPVVMVMALLLGTALCYLLGTLWLGYQMSLSFPAALAAGVIPYIPGDVAKIVVAIIVGPILRKRLAGIN